MRFKPCPKCGVETTKCGCEGTVMCNGLERAILPHSAWVRSSSRVRKVVPTSAATICRAPCVNSIGAGCARSLLARRGAPNQ
jgi:hypothetical protein